MDIKEFTNNLDEAMGFVQKLDYQKGQKPPKTTQKKDTKMTKSVNTPNDLDKAVKMFLKGIQARINDEYKKQYKNLTPPKMIAKKGRRYIKIIRKETFGSGTSVFCFIDAKEGHTFGHVLKAASWNTPAKHSRGSVFDGSWGLNAVSNYGAHYMK